MESRHDKNFIDDQNHSSSGTVGKSGNLNDSSSSAKKNVLSSKQGSQTQFNPYHGKPPNAFQDLHSSSPQNPSCEIALTQTSSLWNVSESSPASPNLQKSENISSKDKEIQVFPGKRYKSGLFTGNEDAIPHTESGTEFNATQDTHSLRQDLSVQQTSKNDGSHLPTFQSYCNVSKESRQLVPKGHNRCNATNKKQSKIELGVTEISETPGSDPSAQQSSESNINRFKECNTTNQPLPWNEPISSQSSYLLYHKAYPSVSNIGQTAHSISFGVMRGHQATNIPSYFGHQGESRTPLDLSLQSFQNPGCSSKVVPNISSQRPKISECDPNFIRKRNSSGHEKSEINLIQDCGLNQTTRNQIIEKKDLHSINRKPAESETRDTQGLLPIPQTLTENFQKRFLPPSYSERKFEAGLYSTSQAESQPSTCNNIWPLPGNRQLPYSHPGQQSKRGSEAIPLAERRPRTCDTFWPGPDNRQLPYSQPPQQFKRTTGAIPLTESRPSTSYNTCPLPENRQLPHSQPGQQLKRGPEAIPLAKSQPSMSETFFPLPGNSLLPHSHYGQHSEKGSYLTPHVERQPSTSENTCTLPGNRQLPPSYPEHQFKREPYAVPLAESQPDTPDTYPLLDTFLQMDSFMKREQFMRSNESSWKVRQEYVDLRMLQHPYSNRSEHINIFVCGHIKWTNILLQSSANTPLNNSSPYYFVFHRNMIRCGILINVFVWKINNLVDSTSFLVSHCLSSRSTIVYVDNVTDRPDLAAALLKRRVTFEIKCSVIKQLSSRLQWMTNFMPKGLGRNVPIVFVWGKYSKDMLTSGSGDAFRKIFNLNYICFRLKAGNNISGYMECSVDSAEEVEKVIFTAIDVSFL